MLSSGPRSRRRSVLAAAVVTAVTTWLGCGTRRPPVYEPLRARDVRVPVIVVPGITGVELVDRESGVARWGDGRSLLFPRDGGASLALDDDGSSRLVAGEPVWDIRFLGIPARPVYRGVRQMFVANGYREGNLAAPRAGEDLYFFSYDWRRSAIETAAELLARLDALRAARGADTLRIRIVAQSDAGRIVRWLVRYGGASLDEAEAGAARPPAWLDVEDLVLVGSANLGAMRTLREMDRGRKYIGGVGRKLHGEVFSTFPGVFEALPAPGTERFVDPRGEPLAVRLHDPDSWVTWGWSGYDQRSAADLVVLARRLDHAARVHRALLEDPDGFAPPRIHRLGSAYAPTASAAVLDRNNGKPRTRFAGDREVDSSPDLRVLARSPGDGHATVVSQEGMSPRESASCVSDPIWVTAKHFEMILDPGAQLQILERFAEAEDSKRTP